MFCWPYPCRSLPSSCPLGTDKHSPALRWPHTKIAHHTPHPWGFKPCMYPGPAAPLLCREKGTPFSSSSLRRFVNLGLLGFLSAQRSCRNIAPRGGFVHGRDREAPRWVQGQTSSCKTPIVLWRGLSPLNSGCHLCTGSSLFPGTGDPLGQGVSPLSWAWGTA